MGSVYTTSVGKYDESSPSSALAVGRCGDVGEHSLTKQESEVSIQSVKLLGEVMP